MWGMFKFFSRTTKTDMMRKRMMLAVIYGVLGWHFIFIVLYKSFGENLSKMTVEEQKQLIARSSNTTNIKTFRFEGFNYVGSLSEVYDVSRKKAIADLLETGKAISDDDDTTEV